MDPETEIKQEQPTPTPPRSKRAIIGFILAFVIPPLGMVLSFIARREIKQRNLRGKRFAIFGIIWGIIFTPLFLLYWLLFFTLGGWSSVIHGNAAQRASKPLVSQIEKAGGKKLCDNGNDGYGIDNTTPWYQAYYRIPDSPGLANEIKGFAGKDGYALRTDTAQIKQLKQNANDNFGDQTQEQFNPRADYLTGKSGGDTLSMTVNRDTNVKLYCNRGKWGREVSTGSDAILFLDFSAPDTNR